MHRLSLPLMYLLLAACTSTSGPRAARTDCDRSGNRVVERLAAVPEQAAQMRRLADENPVSEKPSSSLPKFEHWYRVDDKYVRLCRDQNNQLGVEMWDFEVAADNVALIDDTLLLSLE